MNLNEDQVKIIVKRLSQRLLDLRRVEDLCSRDKMYTPYTYNAEFHQTLKNSIRIGQRVLGRLYAQWDQLDPVEPQRMEFIIGGSHRKLRQHRRILYENGIYYHENGSRQWGVYDLKLLVVVSAHHEAQMKALGFSKPRKKKVQA
jgi:hypothetical protein